MNILIYIPALSRSYGGVYQYTIALADILSEDKENSYYIYCKHELQDLRKTEAAKGAINIIPPQELVLSRIIRIKNKLIELANRTLARLGSGRKLTVYTKIDEIVKKYKIDIIHCPTQNIAISSFSTPTITTMHDVQELHFPEFFTSAERAYRATHYKKCIDQSSAVVVSYDHIKNDIVKYFAKDPGKVFVVLLDMKDLWFERIDPKNINDNVLSFNLFEKFLLYPAATWPHKNHRRLIEAIANLKNEKGIEVNLICTGSKNSRFETEIQPLIDSLELNNQVKFTGIVTDEQLYFLYQKCTGVVIPTLYEAGSFPLMESILMQVPVICSNVTSLPETIGDDRFVFDPYDIQSMANMISELYTSKSFREECIKVENKKADKLRYSGSLAHIQRIYREL